MANLSDNFTDKVKNNKTFDNCPITGYLIFITVTDVVTILVGQPLIAKLLWTAFHSKKKDILNVNLAFFHSLQYLISIIHLCISSLQVKLNITMAHFVYDYVIVGGPMTLSFICLERYIAVVHPTSYPLLKRYRCREACALSVWLLVLPTATLKLLSFKLCLLHELAIEVFQNLVLLLMVVVISWCNVAILKALKKSGPAAADKLHPAKKRAVRTVRAISVIGFLCYIPAGAFSMYSYINGDGCLVVPTVIFLVSVASVAHPIFYLSTVGKLLPCQRPSPTATT